MFTQMLPWLITALTIGLAIGLLIGIALGSTMTRSHYTHMLNGPTRSGNGTQPQPVPKRAGYRYPEDYY
jgi:hypothetical protein